jgi:hypothetical protein
MTYFRITIVCFQGRAMTGIRHFKGDVSKAEVLRIAWDHGAEALGRKEIADIFVTALPANDPAVVAFILKPDNQYEKK